MNTIKMSDEINHDRRRFLGTAVMTIKPGTKTSFGSLK